MTEVNYTIWIEAELWRDIDWDKNDCNTDVIVKFADGTNWIATFFTYQNIKTIAENNKSTGECLNGTYFYSSNMLLIQEVCRKKIEETVKYLMAMGEFEFVFCKCTDSI